ncbi:MAG: hypothetical protein SH868_02870 [Bythopirellula sp.]|nr:hypothetical protein [Bythopirellula sp.]
MQTYESQLDGDINWALMEGSMYFDGNNSVHRTLQRLVKRLEEHGIDYAIAGAMAMFYHGYRRFTEDVDVLVTEKGLVDLHAALDGLGYVRPFEKSKNLRDTESGVKIDFLITGQYPGDGKPGPVAFPHPADVGKSIKGAMVVDLSRLIELKLASGQAPNRIKDLGDVQELIKAIQVPLEIGQEIDPSLRGIFEKLWNDSQMESLDL